MIDDDTPLPRHAKPVDERAREIQEQLGLKITEPTKRSYTDSDYPIGVDLQRPAHEPTLMEHYRARHPELKRAFQKADILEDLSNLQKILAGLTERNRTISTSLAALELKAGIVKKPESRPVAKGKVSAACGVWGCILRNKEPHQHLRSGD